MATISPDRESTSVIGSRIEGAGPAIVLLHSSMSSKSQWRGLMENMSDAFRLIAIDLHGYGDSAMPADSNPHSLPVEVSLVQTQLAQLLAPEERFHLVGHSFGGAVALRLMHAERNRVRSLTLYEPTAFHLLPGDDAGFTEVQAVVHAMERAIQSDDHSSAVEVFIDYWNGQGTCAALPHSRRELFISLLPKVMLDFQALIGDPLRLSDYSDFTVPACVLSGRKSPHSTRTIASLVANALQHRETHEIDAGHMAPLTHAEQVNSFIEDFIRRVEAQHATSPIPARLENGPSA